jgi:hypothetical protein
MFVMGIMAKGNRVGLVELDENGQERPVMVLGPDGETLVQATDYDTPTKFMFMGLKYCLLQMTKLTPVQLEAVQERAADRIERGKAVDKMIAWIFGMPEPPDLVTAEEEAIKRAQQMMGATDGDGREAG